MLRPEELEALLKVFNERWSALITRYLSDMGDHLADIGELLPSDVNRIVEMRRMGVNTSRIQSQIAYAARMSREEIAKIFAKVAQSDARFMERMFGLRRGEALASAGLRAALESQYRVTLGEMENLSRTTVVADGYKNAVDVAVQAVQGGVQDYQSAIRDAIDSAAAEGLRVKYAGGRSMRLDSAARQNVLDGARSLQQAALNALGEELGTDGVEIDAHFLCAEDHLPYQGRQYSNREFADLQASLTRKIGQWNCKHMALPVLLGAPPAYSEDQLKEMRRNSAEIIEIDGKKKSRYEWTQEQRRIETAVRYQKDRGVVAKHAGNMELRRDAQGKINALMGRYEKISEKAGLHERRSRTYVEGFEHVKLNAKSALKKLSGTISSDGISISATEHVIERMQTRNISVEDIIDSLTKPLDIGKIKVDEFGRPSKQYIGKKATTAVNPENGNVVSAWPTSSKRAQKLMEKKE